MRFTKLNASVLALALGSSFVSAADVDAPDWNLVEVGYSQTRIDQLPFKPDGFLVSGSAVVAENILLTASYTDGSDDINGVELDMNQTSVGIGYRYAFSDKTDFYGIVSYEDIEVDLGFGGVNGDADEDGVGFTVGLRSRLTSQIEANLKAGHTTIDEGNEAFVGVGMYYYLTENVAAGVNWTKGDVFSSTSLNVRYAF